MNFLLNIIIFFIHFVAISKFLFKKNYSQRISKFKNNIYFYFNSLFTFFFKFFKKIFKFSFPFINYVRLISLYFLRLKIYYTLYLNIKLYLKNFNIKFKNVAYSYMTFLNYLSYKFFIFFGNLILQLLYFTLFLGIFSLIFLIVTVYARYFYLVYLFTGVSYLAMQILTFMLITSLFYSSFRNFFLKDIEFYIYLSINIILCAWWKSELWVQSWYDWFWTLSSLNHVYDIFNQIFF